MASFRPHQGSVLGITEKRLGTMAHLISSLGRFLVIILACTWHIGDGFCIFPAWHHRKCTKFVSRPLHEGRICKEPPSSSLSRLCKDVRLLSTGSSTVPSFSSAGKKEKGRVVPLERYRNIGIMAHIDAGNL